MGKVLLLIPLLVITAAGFLFGGDIGHRNDETSTRMLHLGDTMLGRQVGKHIKDGTDPFLYVREKMMDYDLVVANLEGPITDTTQCQKKAYSFKFATTTAAMLTDSNIGLVT